VRLRGVVQLGDPLVLPHVQIEAAEDERDDERRLEQGRRPAQSRVGSVLIEEQLHAEQRREQRCRTHQQRPRGTPRTQGAAVQGDHARGDEERQQRPSEIEVSDDRDRCHPPARGRGPRPPPRLVSTTEGDSLFERRIIGAAASGAGRRPGGRAPDEAPSP